VAIAFQREHYFFLEEPSDFFEPSDFESAFEELSDFAESSDLALESLLESPFEDEAEPVEDFLA